MSTSSLTTVQKIKALPWNTAGSAFNAVFVELTVFGSIFILFLNQVGIEKSQIGFILALIPFTGILAPLLAPYIETFGFKRTFIIFFLIRKLIIALLLLVPWLSGFTDQNFLLQYITIVIGAFALARTISEIGYFPWVQEYIPDSLRGKASAQSSIAATITGFLAVVVSSYFLDASPSLLTFSLLFAIGIIAGIASVWAYAQIPHGQISQPAPGSLFRLPNLALPLKDAQFIWFTTSICLIIIATGPMVSFLPLYLTEIINLTDAQVIWLQVGTKIGSLLFGFLWGWAADRYGSRPTTIVSILMMCALPLIWIFLEYMPSYAYPFAFLAALIQGTSFIGWQICHARMLFVSIIPNDHKNDYSAVYYAIVGLIGGTSQILGGWYLDYDPTITFGTLTINAYSSLMFFSLLLILVSVVSLRKIYEHKSIPIREFISFFLYGNTLQAMGSVIRYNRAEGEHQTVQLTEKLGSSNSHLTVNELLNALEDPRFQVRYEAIMSIARTKPNIQLIRALASLLNDQDPAMSVAAAWALGRIGDERCIEALKTGLNSRFQSVRIQSIRSLSYLRTPGLEEEIYRRTKTESHIGLLIAYCSYLGKLKYQPAIKPILSTLPKTDHIPWQRELVLSATRLLGTSKLAIKLFKNDQRPSIELAMSLSDIHKKLAKHPHISQASLQSLQQSADYLSHEQYKLAFSSLYPQLTELIPIKNQSKIISQISNSLSQDPTNSNYWILLVCCL